MASKSKIIFFLNLAGSGHSWPSMTTEALTDDEDREVRKAL
jgi:hypothetical protein